MNYFWSSFFYNLRSWVVRLLTIIGLLSLGWGLYSLLFQQSSPEVVPTMQSGSVSSTTGVVSPTITPYSDDEFSAVIQQVVILSNQARQDHGCNVALTHNSLLTLAAQRHTEDMAQQSYFSHVSPDGKSVGDRVSATGYRWRGVAENIAAGYSSPSTVVTGWMNSPGHRANILNCQLTEIGIGYIFNPNATSPTYRYLWTQVFGMPQ